MPFGKLKKFLPAKTNDVELGDEYIEVAGNLKDHSAKILVRTFNVEKFEDIKHILNVLREGQTIALLNIAPIKDTDRMGLKRAVDKLKKTLDANDGEIAAFGEHWLVATPSFARIYRGDEGLNTDEVEDEGGL